MLCCFVIMGLYKKKILSDVLFDRHFCTLSHINIFMIRISECKLKSILLKSIDIIIFH